MAKHDAYLQGLERRKQQHVAATRGHMDKRAEQMDDEELQAEIRRLQWEKTKAETEFWVARRDANLAPDGSFGLASNQTRYGTPARRNLNALKTNRRPGWR